MAIKLGPPRLHKNLRPGAVIFRVPMQTTAAPWNQAPQMMADLVQIQMFVADRRGQNVDPARTGIDVDRLVNPRAGTHSPNARAPGRKRHIGCPHRLIADVNSLVRLELSPAPTGIGKWRPDPPPEAGAGLSAVKTSNSSSAHPRRWQYR